MTQIDVNKIIEEINNKIVKNWSEDNSAVTKNYQEITAAISKQAPRKIIHEKYTDDWFSPDEEYWLCPRCKVDLSDKIYGDAEYCPYCGQRIKV